MGSLELAITWNCNNRCIFCSLYKLQKKVIDKKSIYHVLDEKKNLFNHVILLGGEPTISKDLLNIVKFAKKKGYIVSIITNGRMLSNLKFCKKLLEKGIDNYIISIHASNKEMHDLLTRSPNSFDQTIKGMANLKKFGKRFITNTVINKLNYKNLPEIISLLKDYSPKKIKLSFPDPRGLPRNYPYKKFYTTKKFYQIIPTYKEIMPYIVKTIDKGKEMNQEIKTVNIPFCIMGKYKEKMEENFYTENRLIVTHVLKDIEVLPGKIKDKSKIRGCELCKYNHICEGIWNDYLKKYGEKEFIPIQDKF